MQESPLTLPSLDDIETARARLRGILVATPLLPFQAHGSKQEAELWLKCENLQRTGSFKIRGAYNRIAGLSAEERERGVVAYSSGNHAQGVACAAALLGVRATIVMPENAVSAKLEATRRYGPEVIFAGTDSETRRRRAEEIAARQGLVLVPPYDHADIIAGQGTLGLEMLEALPTVETVIAPIGGGGLISGIALAIKLSNPRVRVVGAEPDGAADARASWHSGKIVQLDGVNTIADGLRASKVGVLPFEAIRQYVDDVVTVPDSAILDATRRLLLEAHVVAEPSGAVTVAAALAGAARGRTVALISGGNIDHMLLARLAAGPAEG